MSRLLELVAPRRATLRNADRVPWILSSRGQFHIGWHQEGQCGAHGEETFDAPKREADICHKCALAWMFLESLGGKSG